MTRQRMCSWCHTTTVLDVCPTCGHLAGVPRMLCTCKKCRPLEGLTPEQARAWEMTKRLWKADSEGL